MARTPGLDIHDNDGLGSSLGLGSLLLLVGSQALLADTGSLGILLVVVTAEQVDVVILLVGGGRLGGVQSVSDVVGAIDGVRLGGITGQGRKVGLVRGDVLPPASGVGILGGVGALLQGLEAGNIGLGGGVTGASKVSLLIRDQLQTE